MSGKVKSWIWWPALLRLSLFSVLTAGGVFHAQIHGKKTEDFLNYGWVEWANFLTPILLAWLGTKLAFLDQTMGKLREQQEKEGNTP